MLRRSTRKFLDETDVDSYFYLNILDIALIDKGIVRVTKIPTGKFLLSNYTSHLRCKQIRN